MHSATLSPLTLLALLSCAVFAAPADPVPVGPDFRARFDEKGVWRLESDQGVFFVRCGLGDTMTQADIDRGQVIVIVGFAPLKPAEFVIVRIQQKVGQQ